MCNRYAMAGQLTTHEIIVTFQVTGELLLPKSETVWPLYQGLIIRAVRCWSGTRGSVSSMGFGTTLGTGHEVWPEHQQRTCRDDCNKANLSLRVQIAEVFDPSN